MWPFTRKPPPDDDNDLTVQVVGLDEAHSYVQPRGDHPDKHEYGAVDWSPQVGTELPPIAEQDRILVHWYRPPDAGSPRPWWQDANSDKILRGEQERATTDLGSSVPGSLRVEQNPWIGQPQPLPRVTSQAVPANYRFERPFDQRTERTLTGEHFSMASNRRTYQVNGMEPARSFRNTIRLEPVARDAENVDLASTSAPAATPAVYVSPPSVPSSRWGL